MALTALFTFRAETPWSFRAIEWVLVLAFCNATAHARRAKADSHNGGADDQVFKPYDCNLRPWNAEKFSECTAARRIIMIGDSLMRQQFMSLACLANDVVVRSPFSASHLLHMPRASSHCSQSALSAPWVALSCPTLLRSPSPGGSTKPEACN